MSVMADDTDAPRSRRAAFLLSQLGALATTRFGERTRQIGLTPSDAGVLRLLGRNPGLSQRELADRFGAVPSRIVSLVDSLEERGLVHRVRSAIDRRSYELQLTAEGATALRALRRIAEAHDAELLAALSAEEVLQLEGLLRKLADATRVDPDVHADTHATPREP